jgi:hypothetical protein
MKTLTGGLGEEIAKMADEIVHQVARQSEVLRLLKDHRATSTSVANKGNDVSHPGGGPR